MNLLVLTAKYDGEKMLMGRLDHNMKNLKMNRAKTYYIIERPDGDTWKLKAEHVNAYRPVVVKRRALMFFEWGFTVDEKRAETAFLEHAIESFGRVMERLRSDMEKIEGYRRRTRKQLIETIAK